jgi:hypothetical protein
MSVTRVGASSRGVSGGGTIMGSDVSLNGDGMLSVAGVMLALGIMRIRRGKEGRILEARLDALLVLLLVVSSDFEFSGHVRSRSRFRCRRLSSESHYKCTPPSIRCRQFRTRRRAKD